MVEELVSIIIPAIASVIVIAIICFSDADVNINLQISKKIRIDIKKERRT